MSREDFAGDGLPIGDLRGFGRVRADASVARLAFDRDAGLLGRAGTDGTLTALVLDGAPSWVSAYVPGTNVLESTARTDTGELRVVDFMALAEGRPGQAEALSSGRFVRIVTCTEGELSFRMDCGADVAGVGPLTEARSGTGWYLACSRPLDIDRGVATASLQLSAGQSVALVMAQAELSGGPSLVAAALHALGDTIHYWTWWSDRCRYKGDDFDAVLREALSLKLGCSAVGLQVEAPGATGFTTAPPEEMSRAAAHFLALGFRHEAALLHACIDRSRDWPYVA